jgi:hypothetical protein
MIRRLGKGIAGLQLPAQGLPLGRAGGPLQGVVVQGLEETRVGVPAGEDGPGHLGARAGGSVQQGGVEQPFAGVRRAVEEVAIGAVHEPLVGPRAGALADRGVGGVRGQGRKEGGPDGWRPAAAGRPVRRLVTAIHRLLPSLNLYAARRCGPRPLQ